MLAKNRKFAILTKDFDIIYNIIHMENLEISQENVKKFLIKNCGSLLNLKDEKSLPVISWYSPTHTTLFSWVWFLSCGRNLYLSVEASGQYTIGVVLNTENIRFVLGNQNLNAKFGVCKIRGKGEAEPVPDVVQLEFFCKLPLENGYVTEIV